MNVLFMSSEFSPFVKATGLASFSESVALGLVKKGISVTACIPYYSSIQKQNLRISGKISKIEFDPLPECVKLFNLSEKLNYFSILPYKYKGVNIYFIKNDYLFNRDSVYGHEEKGYEDDLIRYFSFCYAAIAFFNESGVKFDIIHANGWRSALVSYISKLRFKLSSKILLTLHDSPVKRVFSRDQMPCVSFGGNIPNIENSDSMKNINPLKCGVKFADAVNIAENWNFEDIKIKIDEGESDSCHDEYLKQMRDVRKIPNGLDYEKWSPETDKHIVKNYSVQTSKVGKKSCKKDVLSLLFGKESVKKYIDNPLFALAYKEGYENESGLINSAIKNIIKTDNFAIIVLLEDDNLESEFLKVFAGGQNIAVKSRSDEALVHKILAGIDFLIMPFNCDSDQTELYALKYGSVPVLSSACVTKNVVCYDGNNVEAADSFQFERLNDGGLERAIADASDMYYNKKKVLSTIITNSMNRDFSWEKTAERYISLYKETLNI